MLQELPEFYEQRIEYFQPSVQALIKSQADYYCESERLFSDLVLTNPSCSENLDENEYQEDIESLNTIAHNRPRAQLVLGKLHRL